MFRLLLVILCFSLNPVAFANYYDVNEAVELLRDVFPEASGRNLQVSCERGGALSFSSEIKHIGDGFYLEISADSALGDTSGHKNWFELNINSSEIFNGQILRFNNYAKETFAIKVHYPEEKNNKELSVKDIGNNPKERVIRMRSWAGSRKWLVGYNKFQLDCTIKYQ